VTAAAPYIPPAVWLTGQHWRPATSAELRPELASHYSRRRVLRRGGRFGGIGRPLLLVTPAGSAFVAVWQDRHTWRPAWRPFPSWWVSAFRRAAADPTPASVLVAAAGEILQLERRGPMFTAIDARRVRARTPGLVFIRAGWRPTASTRPLARWRSLLILRADPTTDLKTL
jgi:hypothetical protein